MEIKGVRERIEVEWSNGEKLKENVYKSDGLKISVRSSDYKRKSL